MLLRIHRGNSNERDFHLFGATVYFVDLAHPYLPAPLISVTTVHNPEISVSSLQALSIASVRAA